MEPSEYDRTSPNFLGLTGTEAEYDGARVVVLPVSYDATTTYRAGARFGPEAILAASRELELYDPQTGREAYLLGIATMAILRPADEGPDRMVQEVAEAARTLLSDGKFPVLLGGEHLVSLGLIKALAGAYGSITVLSLDAHPDLRDSYQDMRLNNACVMRRALETSRVVLCGVRAGDREEWDLIEADSIPCYAAWDLNSGRVSPGQVADSLGPRVHISIDLDVLDPSAMPCVGTPEPGGLTWETVLAVLREVALKRQVVGLDVVELMPVAGLHLCEFTAASLVYKVLSYIMPALMDGAVPID